MRGLSNPGAAVGCATTKAGPGPATGWPSKTACSSYRVDGVFGPRETHADSPTATAQRAPGIAMWLSRAQLISLPRPPRRLLPSEERSPVPLELPREAAERRRRLGHLGEQPLQLDERFTVELLDGPARILRR